MTDSTKENVPAKAPKEKKRTEVDQNKGTLSIPRPVKPSAPPRIPPARFYGKFTDLMNQVADLLSGHLKYPPFPQRFMVYKPGFGGDLILEVGDKQIVTIVDKAYVVKCIVKYTREHMLCEDAFTWTHRQCGECFDFWASATHEHKEEIPAFRWKDEPGLTFHRLPWDKPQAPYDTTLDRAPLFKELMSRISNSKPLMQFIGSLFDYTSARQQYVYLFGDGDDGKGSLISLLKNVFARSFANERPPGKNDKFWTGGLLGKRVIAFEDCDDPGFVTKGLFKALTGGDSERVETKNEGSGFTAKFNLKFIFTSNEELEITNKKADIRRLIYCPIDPRDDIKHPRRISYQEDLFNEGEAFLEACIGMYQEIPYGHDIPVKSIADDPQLDKIVSSSNERFELFFVENLHLFPGKKIRAIDLYKVAFPYFGKNADVKKFKSYLKKTYGVKESRSNQGIVLHDLQLRSVVRV